MTQSFSCWNHLKSFLRSQLVILAWSLWETLEIIFHLQTLSQSDYRKKNHIQIVSLMVPYQGISQGYKKYKVDIQFVSFSHFKSLNHYTESIKIYQEKKWQYQYLFIDSSIFFQYKASNFKLSQSEYISLICI